MSSAKRQRCCSVRYFRIVRCVMYTHDTRVEQNSPTRGTNLITISILNVSDPALLICPFSIVFLLGLVGFYWVVPGTIEVQ